MGCNKSQTHYDEGILAAKGQVDGVIAETWSLTTHADSKDAVVTVFEKLYRERGKAYFTVPSGEIIALNTDPDAWRNESRESELITAFVIYQHRWLITFNGQSGFNQTDLNKFPRALDTLDAKTFWSYDRAQKSGER
jgi:hypothetical protein